MCDLDGDVVAATVVDHIVPHRGDKVAFWDHDNWQALCKRHHDKKTAGEESYRGSDGQWGGSRDI